MNTGFIDWTENSLNFYLFEKNGKQYKLINSSSFDIEGNPGPEILGSLPKEEIEKIHLSIPFNLLTIREQSFPFSDKDKINESLPYELEGVLLGSPGEYTIDHINISSENNLSNVMAVCIEKSKLNEIIETFSTAGLDPKIVTSLDLRISNGDIEELFNAHVSDTDIRSAAAEKEILGPSVNLRQEELAYTGDIVKLKKSFRLTAALILALLLIVGANTSLKLIHLNKEHAFLSNEMVNIYKRVFPEDRKIVDVKRQFNGNLNTLKKKNAALASISVLDILQEIASQKEISGINLHEFSADGKNVIIKGTANSFEDVESFKNALSQSFQNAKVTDSDSTVDKKINFTIIMQEKTA